MKIETVNSICSVFTPLLALLAAYVGLVKGNTRNASDRRLTRDGWILLTLSSLTAVVAVSTWYTGRVVAQNKATQDKAEKAAMNAKADATILQIRNEKEALQDQLNSVHQSLQSSSDKVIDLQHTVISAQSRSLELSEEIRISQMEADSIEITWYITGQRQKKIDEGVNAVRATRLSGANILWEPLPGISPDSLALRYGKDAYERTTDDVDIEDPKVAHAILRAVVPDVWLESKATNARVDFRSRDLLQYDASSGRELIRVAGKGVTAKFFLDEAILTMDVRPGELPLAASFKVAGSGFQADGIARFDENAVRRQPDFLIGYETRPFRFDVRFVGENKLSGTSTVKTPANRTAKPTAR